MNSHMKLPYIERDYWSMKVSIAYLDWERLSKVAGRGLSPHLLPDVLQLETQFHVFVYRHQAVIDSGNAIPKSNEGRPSVQKSFWCLSVSISELSVGRYFPHYHSSLISPSSFLDTWCLLSSLCHHKERSSGSG